MPGQSLILYLRIAADARFAFCDASPPTLVLVLGLLEFGQINPKLSDYPSVGRTLPTDIFLRWQEPPNNIKQQPKALEPLPPLRSQESSAYQAHDAAYYIAAWV